MRRYLASKAEDFLQADRDEFLGLLEREYGGQLASTRKLLATKLFDRAVEETLASSPTTDPEVFPGERI